MRVPPKGVVPQVTGALRHARRRALQPRANSKQPSLTADRKAAVHQCGFELERGQITSMGPLFLLLLLLLLLPHQLRVHQRR